MATHSSILVRIIPWTEEPGWPQSIGSEEFDTTEPTHTHKLSLKEAERMWVQRETMWFQCLHQLGRNVILPKRETCISAAGLTFHLMTQATQVYFACIGSSFRPYNFILYFLGSYIMLAIRSLSTSVLHWDWKAARKIGRKQTSCRVGFLPHHHLHVFKVTLRWWLPSNQR